MIVCVFMLFISLEKGLKLLTVCLLCNLFIERLRDGRGCITCQMRLLRLSQS